MICNHITNHSKTQMLKTVNVYDLLRLQEDLSKAGLGLEGPLALPGQSMLITGPLHPTGQLECPYNTAAGTPQHVVQQSQEEVPAPPKSPVSLHRLVPLRLPGATEALTANGRLTGANLRLRITPVTAGEVLASPQASHL